MANQNNLHAKHKPSQQPHPPHFFNGPSLSYCWKKRTNGLNQTDSVTIAHYRNYMGNGYKLSAKRFVGSFGWTRVGYDWSWFSRQLLTNHD